MSSSSLSTFDSLVADLTRDVHRVQPRDTLQFCANWFQSRLEEQRTRTRDILSQQPSHFSLDIPHELYTDAPLRSGTPSHFPSASRSFTSSQPNSLSPRMSNQGRPIFDNPFGHASPFGGAPPEIVGPAPHAPSPFGNSSPFAPRTASFSPASNMGQIDPNYGFGVNDNSSPSHFGSYLNIPSSHVLQRRDSVSAESLAIDGPDDHPLPVYPKTDDQLRRIRASIPNNFIFRELTEEQFKGVVGAMQELRVGKDEIVIRQGSAGDYFYIVESGILDCYRDPDGLPPPEVAAHDLGRREKFLMPGYHPVFGKKETEYGPKDSFGELALMYSAPRAATIIAMEPSVLWQVDRITFRTIVLKLTSKRRKMYEEYLSSVPLLVTLEQEERSKVADALVSRVIADGDPVVRQGEMGDKFYFVEEGEAVVTKIGEEGEEKEVNRLTKGDYFGELSLLHQQPRAATVSAVRRTDSSAPMLKVAELDADVFTRLLGPRREFMERQAGDYKLYNH